MKSVERWASWEGEASGLMEVSGCHLEGSLLSVFFESLTSQGSMEPLHRCEALLRRVPPGGTLEEHAELVEEEPP